MKNDIKNVCVYCASSTQIGPAYFEAARQLGTLLAEAGIGVVNGAGRMGLMAAVSNAALAAGGRVTGVIPRFMVEQGWQHTGLTQLVEVDNMHQRKRLMAQWAMHHSPPGRLRHAGGAARSHHLKQLGLYLKPVVLLNVNGYYDPLLAMFRRAVDEHFMRPQHAGIWHVHPPPPKPCGW